MKKFIMLVLMFLFTPAIFVYAEEGKLFMEPVGPGASGYFYIEGKPGETHNLTFKIKNSSEDNKGSATIFVSDAITGKGGGMATMTPELATREHTGKWLDFTKKVIEVKPNGSKTETIQMTIPSNAQPGDHIANVILYKYVPAEVEETKGNENRANVVVNKAYSQSYAVWVKIPGEETHHLEATQVVPTWNGSDLFLDVYFKNKGNVLEKSNGTIKVFKNDKLLMEQNATMGSIYPNTTSFNSFLITNDEAKQPGEYTVEVDWTYGKNKITKELTYEIEAENTKKAEKVEKATDKVEKPGGIYITMSDLIIYGAIALVLLSIFITILIVWLRKNKQGN